VPNKEVGIKYDEGKPRYALVPWEQFEEVVKVITFGSKKYNDYNWQKLENPHDRLFSASVRHMVKWKSGELLDDETGINHLAHAVCSLLFLMWHDDHQVRFNKNNLKKST
jgi:hypothetical protein